MNEQMNKPTTEREKSHTDPVSKALVIWSSRPFCSEQLRGNTSSFLLFENVAAFAALPSDPKEEIPSVSVLYSQTAMAHD